MEKNYIRFGVIGTNNITEWFLNGAREVDDFKLSAVYSRTEEKANCFADKHKAEYRFTNLEEMAKSDKIDAVYIASPNSCHFEQAMLFMENGKHVLCEKAFASNSKEVEEMIDSARRNNVVLMEAMKITLLPNFKAIINNIHKIGKIRGYFASYCQYSSRYDKYKEGIILNAFKPDLSNGALMDIGVYTIAPMVALFGKPKSVKGISHMLESGVDGSGTLICDYGDMTATTIYSKISNSYLPSEIEGENGSIIIDRINKMDNIKIIYRNGTEEIISTKQNQYDMCYEVDEFISLIQNGKIESDINSLSFSKTVMEIMDQVRKSK